MTRSDILASLSLDGLDTLAVVCRAQIEWHTYALSDVLAEIERRRSELARYRLTALLLCYRNMLAGHH